MREGSGTHPERDLSGAGEGRAGPQDVQDPRQCGGPPGCHPEVRHGRTEVYPSYRYAPMLHTGYRRLLAHTYTHDQSVFNNTDMYLVHALRHVTLSMCTCSGAQFARAADGYDNPFFATAPMLMPNYALTPLLLCPAILAPLPPPPSCFPKLLCFQPSPPPKDHPHLICLHPPPAAFPTSSPSLCHIPPIHTHTHTRMHARIHNTHTHVLACMQAPQQDRT